MVFSDISTRKAVEKASGELNTRLQERIEETGRLKVQAVRDALTGLYNRRYFDEMLERKFCWVRREKGALCLVMFDLDHFTYINDAHGYQVGDAVLREERHFLIHAE